MGNSSVLGVDPAPTRAPGTDSDALGPSDSSDSGSDLIGAGPDEVAGEPMPEREAADISVDHVVDANGEDVLDDEDDPDAAEDPDLGFMGEAVADMPPPGEGDGEVVDPTDGQVGAR